MPSDPDPYYRDDLVTIYQGDALELLELLELSGAVVITDPPYGIAWHQRQYNQGREHDPIAGDDDTSVRDAALELLEGRPGAVFGHWRRPVRSAFQALIYAKAPDSGIVGALAGFRSDWEMIYLVGPWPRRPAARSGIIRTADYLRSSTNLTYARRHPHRKPLDVLVQLIDAAPEGIIVDPFAGSGSTLVAAKLLGRQAIGIEIDPDWCALAARRCSQETLGL